MTPQQNEARTKERLVLSVIAQIQRDLYDHELQSVFDMLLEIDARDLQSFLSKAGLREHMRYN